MGSFGSFDPSSTQVMPGLLSEGSAEDRAAASRDPSASRPEGCRSAPGDPSGNSSGRLPCLDAVSEASKLPKDRTGTSWIIQMARRVTGSWPPVSPASSPSLRRSGPSLASRAARPRGDLGQSFGSWSGVSMPSSSCIEPRHGHPPGTAFWSSAHTMSREPTGSDVTLSADASSRCLRYSFRPVVPRTSSTAASTRA